MSCYLPLLIVGFAADIVFTKEYDVVIIGAGLTGLGKILYSAVDVRYLELCCSNGTNTFEQKKLSCLECRINAFKKYFGIMFIMAVYKVQGQKSKASF